MGQLEIHSDFHAQFHDPGLVQLRERCVDA